MTCARLKPCLSRLAGRAAPTLAAVLFSARAQAAAPQTTPPEGVIALDTVIVSATRTPQDVGTLPASVSRLALAELDLAQITDLPAALDRVPGIAVVNTGATGGPTSIFMRGASSHQVLFFVDGVRMNDRSAAYFNFLGGADLGSLERLEVLRGPQSTLYGSSALGGVILLETARGRGPTSGAIAVTGGSFGTRGASAAIRGGDDRAGYSASLGYERTENDRPNNDFEQWSAAARIEGRLTDTVIAGATVRAQRGDYAEPGSRLFASLADVDSDNTLATAYVEAAPRDDFRSRLTYGRHARKYTYADTWSTTVSRNTRDIVDWQNIWTISPALELVAGANAEWSDYDISGSRTRDDVLAEYASVVWRASPVLVATAGLRHDTFESAGSAVTGRAGVAWLLNERGTKLRASFGTGFSAPGSDDRYGVPLWGQLASPNLRPEKSRGWDVGLDQSFNDGRATVSVTWFENQFRDLFDYEIVDFDTFAGRTINRLRATTRGAELGFSTRPLAAVTLAGSYTYLEAFNRADHSRLARRPRHTADVDLHVQVSAQWLVGGGVHVAADRHDGGARIEDYTTVRLYATCAVRPDLLLKLRVENALDETYEEVLGYASLPRAVYGGVEWQF